MFNLSGDGTLGSKKVYSLFSLFQIKKVIFLVLKYLLRIERKALTLYLPNTYIYITARSVLNPQPRRYTWQIFKIKNDTYSAHLCARVCTHGSVWLWFSGSDGDIEASEWFFRYVGHTESTQWQVKTPGEQVKH